MVSSDLDENLERRAQTLREFVEEKRSVCDLDPFRTIIEGVFEQKRDASSKIKLID